MGKSNTRLGTMCELGVPVRSAVGGGPYAGRDGQGRSCLYATMGQESAGGRTFVLQIDIQTGGCQRMDTPSGIAGVRPCLWSEKWQTLFIGATGLENAIDSVAGCLLYLDHQNNVLRSAGPLRSGANLRPCSVAEGADGTIYIGCYGDCSLVAYDPATHRYRDFGRMDEFDMYFYAACGADGTVAGLVQTARPHVVVLDPATGAHRAVGPVADTDTGRGHVNLFHGTDGLLYIDSHEGFFRVQGMDAVPVADRPMPAPEPVLPDGSSFRWLDGHAERGHAWKTIELRLPAGKQRVLRLDYQADGAAIYIVRSGPDGLVYGSSVLPMHFFTADPRSGKLIDYGACSTASGEAYSMDWLDGKLYLCVYTHALLCVYDPRRLYSFSNMEERNGEVVRRTEHWSSDPAFPLRFQFGPDDNPRQLGRMDLVAYRSRDMVAGPAGKVWVVSMPDYGMWGGTLSWYDPKADRFGGAHRHIWQDCSPFTITHLADRDLLLIGFCIYGGSGTRPRVTRTGFALWDPNADRAVWKGDLGLEIIGVMDVEDAGHGLAYAIVHVAPENVLHAELLLVDFTAGRIVSRFSYDSIGWPLEVSFQKDVRYLYGATREAVYRVPLGTTEIEVLWRTSPKEGPTAAGALLDGSYYFGCLEKLRSVRVVD